MLDIYMTEKGRTVVVVPGTLSKDKALTIANKHFKEKKSNLEILPGKLKRGMLEIGTEGNKWCVQRKGRKE